jgi:hypothetical protein
VPSRTESGDILLQKIEAIGYLGSELVVVSLLMTRILRLRVVGLMGAATFLLYGLKKAQPPGPCDITDP